VIGRAWKRWNAEQRVAAVASVLLIVSTFGPFSFVEVAEILLGAAVLALLSQRAEGRQFHLPFGDGTVIFAAGVWAALLIVVRLFDRPLGQNLLALACAALLALAGIRERSVRPPDDLPPDARPPVDVQPEPWPDRPPPAAPRAPAPPHEGPTRRLPAEPDDATRRLPAD
jgi:hypothetical protein